MAEIISSTMGGATAVEKVKGVAEEVVETSLEMGRRMKVLGKQKKERRHITLGPSSLEILEELRQKTDTNNTMVFRNALRLYAALIEEAEKGNEFYTRSSDGDYVRYKVFL